jgi:hypothetical protein
MNYNVIHRRDAEIAEEVSSLIQSRQRREWIRGFIPAERVVLLGGSWSGKDRIFFIWRTLSAK